MPDVVRSDSQRSDTSLRPRVSFNRDVHVKRIVPRTGQSSLELSDNSYSLNPSGRKDRTRSKREFFEDPVQVDKSKFRDSEKKFYTLPRTRKHNGEVSESLTSLDRRLLHEKSPKKPQRIFAPQYRNQENKTPTGPHSSKKSLKKSKPKKGHLYYSVSDAARSKSYERLNDKNRTFDVKEQTNSLRSHKKQLSPIVEQTPRDDYFSSTPIDNKENENNLNVSNSKIKGSKEHINGDDRTSRHESKKKGHSSKKNEKKIIVIDIDKAEDISKSKKSKLKGGLFGRRLKSITNKKNKQNEQAESTPQPKSVEEKTRIVESSFHLQPSPRAKQARSSENPDMIHSSQKPAERPPLTKGRTVNLMVKRLSHDTTSPPPKPSNVMVIPTHFNQHNNNQPFSYTRGLSPEKYMSDENITSSSEIPVIYAQVVCNNDKKGLAKQTVHTTYCKRYSHSDSDEGLGTEETSGLIRPKYGQKTVTHFGDEVQMRRENLITSKALTRSSGDVDTSNYDSDPFFDESCHRGRGDGMESKKVDSLERLRRGMETDESDSARNSLSVRRDLLESRITKKIHDKLGSDSKFDKSVSSSPSPVGGKRQNKKYASDLEHSSSRYYYSTDEPKSFDSSDYNRQFLENKEGGHKKYEMKYRTTISKNLCMSTPDIYHNTNEPPKNHRTFHDSLQRDKYKKNRLIMDKNKFGDSGIESDIKRDSFNKSSRYCSDSHIESEDEGFASSLLIASEKQHTEDNINRTVHRKEYDSDMTFVEEDDPYHHMEDLHYKVSKSYNDEYVPRERSIDDGSHFDPRIDKELTKEQHTLTRNEKKPPKPEKKSGLKKMKQLFTRSSKKKEKQEMVREESLLARYTMYKGSDDDYHQKKNTETNETNKDAHYGTRKRLPTPSPNSSQTRESQPTKKSWLKSLDRISRSARKKEEEKASQTNHKEPESKNLRFFGDTDSDSGENSRKTLKPQNRSRDRPTSQSWRDLHNISEEMGNLELHKKSNGYKSMVDISDTNKEFKNSRSNQKPPLFPSAKNVRDVPKPREHRRKKYEHSSVEGSTEGDSSQQSQRSVVYLHAATVGDIPGPNSVKYGSKSGSKEELAINDSSRIQPQTKTLSRSFSVLAPWRPRHTYEDRYIDYSQHPDGSNGNRKENVSSSKATSQQISDMNHKNRSFTLTRAFRSKDSLNKIPKKEPPQRSSTLYKKKERISRENSRYNKEKDERKNSTKSHSVESLRNIGRLNKKGSESNRNISRSVSMPKDPMKLAGWYKNNKKDRNKSEYIMQRV